MDITKNKYKVILFSLCMILFTGCGGSVDSQQSDESSEWEKLYEQWQENELEIKLSFGKEIYSVSVERRCGDGEGNSLTYAFSLYDTDREEALGLLTKEELILTNNVLKVDMGNSASFCIVDDSGCIKEIGFPATADGTDPVYFTVSYLFPYRDKGDVRMSFVGELAHEDWKELMGIVNRSMAEESFDEIVKMMRP